MGSRVYMFLWLRIRVLGLRVYGVNLGGDYALHSKVEVRTVAKTMKIMISGSGDRMVVALMLQVLAGTVDHAIPCGGSFR